MAKPENHDEVLFAMKNIVTTCGVSRATLLRYEEEGLISPAYKDPDSGYRYYSLRNLSEIISILQYQHLGFTKKEIRDFLNDPEKILDGVDMLRKKHLILLRELDNLIADLGGTEKNTGNLNIRVMPTFGGTFYTRTTEKRFTPENMQAFSNETLEEFLRANIHGNTQQTMKIFVDDADYVRCIGQFDGRKHRIRAIIPTMKKESGADIIEIPPCTMLTLAVRCDYEKSGKFFRALWDRATELGFTPDGPIGIAGLPDSFTERDFTRTDSTLRLMLRTTTPAQRLEV